MKDSCKAKETELECRTRRRPVNEKALVGQMFILRKYKR